MTFIYVCDVMIDDGVAFSYGFKYVDIYVTWFGLRCFGLV